MFFFEWVLPLLAVLTVIVTIFYLSVRNKSGAGIRTQGRTLVDKPENRSD